MVIRDNNDNTDIYHTGFFEELMLGTMGEYGKSSTNATPFENQDVNSMDII